MSKQRSIQMKSALVFFSSTLYLSIAGAAVSVDSATIYSKHTGQVYNAESVQPVSLGFIEGDDVPYLTWNGIMSGKKMYVELHGGVLNIHAGNRKWTLRLDEAYKMPGEHVAEMDTLGTDLYVRSSKRVHDSALCIESLLPGVSRGNPNRSVYVITNPVSEPRLYQMPSLYGACMGLMEKTSGVYAVPMWSRIDAGNAQRDQVSKNPSDGCGRVSNEAFAQRYQVRYHLLTAVGFGEASETLNVTGVDCNIDEFVIENVSP